MRFCEIVFCFDNDDEEHIQKTTVISRNCINTKKSS